MKTDYDSVAATGTLRHGESAVSSRAAAEFVSFLCRWIRFIEITTAVANDETDFFTRDFQGHSVHPCFRANQYFTTMVPLVPFL